MEDLPHDLMSSINMVNLAEDWCWRYLPDATDIQFDSLMLTPGLGNDVGLRNRMVPITHHVN